MDQLICPKCSPPGRIGSRRGECALCNRFAQAVNRRIATALKRSYPHDVERLRPVVEQEVYGLMAEVTHEG